MASSILEYFIHPSELGALGNAVQGRFGINFGKGVRAQVRVRALFMCMQGQWKEMTDSQTHFCVGVRRESGTS